MKALKKFLVIVFLMTVIATLEFWILKNQKPAEALPDDQYADILEESPDSLCYSPVVLVSPESSKAEITIMVPKSSDLSVSMKLLANGNEIGATGMIPQGYQVTEMDLDQILEIPAKGEMELTYYKDGVPFDQETKTVELVPVD